MFYRPNPIEYTGNIRVEHPVKVEEPPSPFEVVGAVVYNSDADSFDNWKP